jgi:DNA (cytosine-5)-methyltransferase 1
MAGKDALRLHFDPLFAGLLPSAVTVMEAIGDLPEIPAGGSANQYRSDVIPSSYAAAMRGNRDALTMHEATAHGEKMLEIIRHSGTNRSALPEGMTSSGFSSCYSRLEPDKPSVTLTVNFVHPSSNRCIHPYQDRALTPREGARLQGFPDAFEFSGTRAQIVKQIGNAVPPILGRAIANQLALAMGHRRPSGSNQNTSSSFSTPQENAALSSTRVVAG